MMKFPKWLMMRSWLRYLENNHYTFEVKVLEWRRRVQKENVHELREELREEIRDEMQLDIENIVREKMDEERAKMDEERANLIEEEQAKMAEECAKMEKEFQLKMDKHLLERLSEI